MYSSNDFERLFIRYKSEAVPRGESMQSFCEREKVPYNLFFKWYKDTRHKVVPIQVVNVPDGVTDVESPIDVVQKKPEESVRILMDLHVSNGLHVRQGNLSYDGLKRLVENLEVLC